MAWHANPHPSGSHVGFLSGCTILLSVSPNVDVCDPRWWEVPYYWAGAKVYDLVASFHKSVPSSYYIGRCVTHIIPRTCVEGKLGVADLMLGGG